MNNINTFIAMLEDDTDNVMLHYSLSHEYYKEKKIDEAIQHLKKTIQLKPDYSAAWKLYGRVLADTNRKEEAIAIYEQGIAIAEKNRDMQAVKEMRVFLKRLKK